MKWKEFWSKVPVCSVEKNHINSNLSCFPLLQLHSNSIQKTMFSCSRIAVKVLLKRFCGVFINRCSSFLSFGELKLYFGSYANHLFLCFDCFCAMLRYILHKPRLAMKRRRTNFANHSYWRWPLQCTVGLMYNDFACSSTLKPDLCKAMQFCNSNLNWSTLKLLVCNITHSSKSFQIPACICKTQ